MSSKVKRNDQTTMNQISTSFPGENEKKIDYVIVYEKPTSIDEAARRAENMRRQFFDELERETFELYFYERQTSKKTNVYVLLHCSTERLYEEAERVRLVMGLNADQLLGVCENNSLFLQAEIERCFLNWLCLFIEGQVGRRFDLFGSNVFEMPQETG